jgi:membrane-anchored glycerophosphoryl diester phosphodiesterase (GDPDase)
VFVLPLAAILVGILVATGGSGAIESLNSGAPQPAAAGMILLFVAVVFAISIRFQMVVPVATAETANPIEILKRSWELTRGHYWRLLGFLLVALLFAVVVLLSAQILGGILGRIAFGDAKPFTIGALVVSLISAAAQAVFTCLIGVMLARIYVQLAGRGTVGVPNSGT